MLHVRTMPHGEEDVPVMTVAAPPGERWPEVRLIRIERCQRNPVIPRDYPETVGIIRRKLLNALPCPFGVAVAGKRG